LLLLVEVHLKKAFIISFIVILFCQILNTYAQKPSTTTTDSLAITQPEYQFLKTQTQEFRKFVEDERKHHREFLEDLYSKIVWFAGAAVTLAIGFFIFFDIRSRKDIKQMITQKFEEYGLRIIDERNKSIKIDIDALRQLLNHETNYKRKRILFLTSQADKEKFESRELKIIDSRGMQNYEIMHDFDKALPLIVRETFDVVVYCYNPLINDGKNEGDQAMLQMLETLRFRQSKIPFIVYNYEKGIDNRINNNDKTEMDKYPYAVLANFPITLVNLLHTVTNYFPVS